MPAPEKIRVCYVDKDSGHQGRLSDGRLYIAYVTAAALEGQAGVDRVIAVLHLFDSDGNHLSTESRLGGYCQRQDTFPEDHRQASVSATAALDQLLAELARFRPQHCPIDIRPFGLPVGGVDYGFFYRPGTDEAEGIPEVVVHMPRDHWYWPPWNTGDYDT